MGLSEGFFRGAPVDTGIGYGEAVFQTGVFWWWELLIAVLEVALDHGAGHPETGILELSQGLGEDEGLVGGVLPTVSVTAVDHDWRVESALIDDLLGFANGFIIIVGTIFATAEDEVAG